MSFKNPFETMETLVVRIIDKKKAKLIKDLLTQLEIEFIVSSSSNKNILPKKNPLSEKEFRAMGGIAKGQLISKEHLRSISWKKRNW
jgi:hypothetical protein